MIQAAPLIRDVARYLSDYDSSGDATYQYREWSQEDLLSYFRLAVQHLVSTDPKAFTKTVSVGVPADGLLMLPPECEECLSVLRYVGADGKTTNKPHFSDTSSFVTTRPLCAGGTGATSVSIVRDDVDRRALFITPATPGGKVLLSCTNTPDISDVNAQVDIPTKHTTAIFNFMVSYAYGVDTESAPMRARSDEHWNRGMSLLSGGAAKSKATK
jgi:hypothetical protein